MFINAVLSRPKLGSLNALDNKQVANEIALLMVSHDNILKNYSEAYIFYIEVSTRYKVTKECISMKDDEVAL